MIKNSWSIVLVYFLVGLIWVEFSGRILLYLFSDYSLYDQSRFSILKGFTFISITSLLLYKLITKYVKTLKKSEEEYREIFEACNYPMWIFSVDTFKFLKVNQATIDKYGYSEKEFLKMSVLDIREEKDRDIFISYFKTTKHIPHDAGIWTHKTKNGEIIKMSVKSHIIENSNKSKSIVVMAIDITEKIKHEAQLNQTIKELKFNRDNLKKTQRIAKIAGWKYIISKNQFFISSDFHTLLGLEEQDLYLSPEILKKHFNDCDCIKFDHFIHSFLNDKKSLECIISMQHSKSAKYIRFWAENNVNKETDFIEGFVRDITENTLKDELVNSTLQRFELIAKTTNDALYEWDVETKTVNWIGNFEGLMGYADHTEKIRQEKWWVERMHPEDLNDNKIKLMNCLRLKQPTLKRKYRFRIANGSYKLIYDHSIIQYNDKGHVEKVIGSIQDIDELTKINVENKKLVDIISKVKNYIVITDENGSIEWINLAFTELTGFTLEDIKGKKPGDILQGPESNLETKQRMSSAIKGVSYFSEEIINYTKTGNKYWVQIDCNPIYDDHNKHIGFIAVQSEVTERKLKEEKIQEQNKLLKQVAWINSHQIRKPVASILGLIQLLNYAENQEEKAQYLNLLEICSIELDDMVKNAIQMLNSEDAPNPN